MSLEIKSVNWCAVHRIQFSCDKQCSKCVRPATGLVNELEREIIRLNDEIRIWRDNFNMYRSAWLREIGGFIVRKSWEIDGFVLRTRNAIREAEERGEKQSSFIVKDKDNPTHGWVCTLEIINGKRIAKPLDYVKIT